MTDSTDETATNGSAGQSASNERAENEHDAEDESDVPRSQRSDQSRFNGVEDGCGCAEVWEHLSDQRENAREERERARANGGD